MQETDVDRTEVLVIGSGMAGICSAIQAARLGCSVTLVEKDEVLGGNSSVNLGIHISGAHSFHAYAAETGIINEIEEEAAYYYAKTRTHGHHYNIARQWDSTLRRILDDAGVSVWRRNYAKSAVMDGRRIAEVIVEDLATYNTRRFEVGVAVVDASGDGQIAFTAGADHRMGREARSEFHERGAPEFADTITMGTSVTALVRKASYPVPFIPPPGTPPFEVGYGYGRDQVSTDCVKAHASWDPEAEFCFLWHTETGGNQDTIADDHEIYERLLLQLYAVWNHIKNEAHQEESENWELVWVSPKAGKRESRRFLGDYVLTQTDVETAASFPDSVAYGGYAVDLHDPVGDQARVRFHSIPPLYSIPYRCLYSRNVENLFLAGRLISVTHVALGTARLQKTLGAAGQAVGAAAYLCKLHSCGPREVWRSHMEELQQLLLKNDATILGLHNSDPWDLARAAVASASSEITYECGELTRLVGLDQPRGIMFWDWGRRIDFVDLYLSNEGPTDVHLEASLHFLEHKRKWKESRNTRRPDHIDGPSNRMEWGGDNDIERFRKIGSLVSKIPAGHEGWARFSPDSSIQLPPKDATTDEERLLLLLPTQEHLSWGCREVFADFGVSCRLPPQSDAYVTECALHLFRVGPRPPYGEATNVLNGFNRRFCTNPVNMWISQREAGLPQTVTLDFGSEVELDEVRLTFDTMYRTYREMPFNDGTRRASGMCVRDYEVHARQAGRWGCVVKESGNYRRFRVHPVPKMRTDSLRLVVLATNEPGWPARVYEIRAYGPKHVPPCGQITI